MVLQVTNTLQYSFRAYDTEGTKMSTVHDSLSSNTRESLNLSYIVNHNGSKI
jgi:hypothetical protein